MAAGVIYGDRWTAMKLRPFWKLSVWRGGFWEKIHFKGLSWDLPAGQLSPGVPGPLFPVVFGLPWVLKLVSEETLARCGWRWAGDG